MLNNRPHLQANTQPITIYWLFVTCILASMSLVPTAHTDETGRAYLFLLDRVTWRDIEECRRTDRGLNAVIEKGSVAALNTQTADGISSLRAAITLGTGIEADGDDDSGEAYNADESVDLERGKGAEVFTRRAGTQADGYQVLVTKIGSIRRRNVFLQGRSWPGMLGTLLSERGLKTAALGCSDLSPEGKTLWQYKYPGAVTQFGSIVRHRIAPLIAMDRQGRVALGDVSDSVLTPDPEMPFGWATNGKAVLTRLDELLRRQDVYLIAIDSGDTFRADEYSPWADPGMASKYRSVAIHRASDLLSGILRRFNPAEDRLFIVPLSPPRESSYDLCPLIAFGKGFSPNTLLTSASTRRPGVVTIPDLTVTLLHDAGVTPPSSLQGSMIHAVPARGTWQQVGDLIEQCAVMDGRLRIPALTALAIVEALILVWALVALLYDASTTTGSAAMSGKGGKDLLSISLLALLLLPLVLFHGTGILLHSPSPVHGIAEIVAICLLGALVLSCAVPDKGTSVLIITGLTVLSITYDLVTGTHISFDSILGYSPFIGARYYGLGNECMAILMGSLLVFAAVVISRLEARQTDKRLTLPTVVAAVLFLPCLALIGAPSLGSDIGGTVAGGIGLGVALLHLRGWKLTVRHWGGLTLCMFLLVAVYAWIDLRHATSESHLGHLVTNVSSQGPQVLWEMIFRKLQILGRSFRHWHWDLTLAIILTITAFLPKMRREGRLPVLDQFPAYHACMVGLFWGTIVAFTINDSGPVVPDLAALYAYASLFYLSRR